MSDLKRLRPGETAKEIPGRTWNALVEGEERRRANGPPNVRGPQGGEYDDPASPARVFIKNESGSEVPTGGVLRLTGVGQEPADFPGCEYAGPIFTGATPIADDTNQHVAILTEPVSDGLCAWGIIPNSWWAKVNITDAGHTFAKPKASVDELESDASTGYPIIWKESGTGAGKWTVIKLVRDVVINVYEFRRCGDAFATLFLDNAEIGQHEAGEVAIIEQEGFVDCWELIGPAPHCKTGECALIVGWKDECVSCYYLTPCGGGSPTFVRERHCGEWARYAGKVVKLAGPGHEGCYSVAKADGCFDVNEELTTEHIVDVYENCDGCGCYLLENCDDDTDTVYVSGDLATLVGQTSGEDAIGEKVKRRGVCYTITAFANPCGAEPEVWDLEEVERIESCDACCYLLTPCEGQPGDPDPIYLKLKHTDNIDPADFLNGNVSNGRVIMLVGYVCYTWSVPETCPVEDVIVGIPTVLEEFDSCDQCAITCWERCDSPGTYIRTYSDLSDVGPNAAVKRAEDGKCYTRETSPGTCGTPAIVEFTIQEIIDEGSSSCTICQTPKVKLTASCGSACGDCEGGSSGGSGSGASTIVTDDDAFFEHVGKYIKMEGVCRLVEWTTDALSGTVGCWTGPFDSCEACRAAPSQLKVVAFVGGVDKLVTIEGVFNVCGEEEIPECES